MEMVIHEINDRGFIYSSPGLECVAFGTGLPIRKFIDYDSDGSTRASLRKKYGDAYYMLPLPLIVETEVSR